MKRQAVILWSAGIAGFALMFVLGYCTSGSPSDVVSRRAFETAKAQFDSARADYDARHQAALATADSLQAVVAAKDTAIDEAAVSTARALADKREADATVRRLTNEALEVGGAKGAFDAQAYYQAQQALTVNDTVIARMSDQLKLLTEQNDALRAQNELLRAQLAASDSLVAAAAKTVEAGRQANLTLEKALHRERTKASVYRGTTFAASGAAALAGVLLIVANN